MPHGQTTLGGSLPRKFQEEKLPLDPGPEDLYHEWGFTIYRTAYCGLTDTFWEALIQAIRVNLRACISTYYTDEEQPISEDEKEAGKLLFDLFRLDDRSGLNLKDKSLDDLRDSYHKEPFHWSKDERPDTTTVEPSPTVFFVADAEVLKAVEAGIYVFKCVDMDFYQRSHVQTSRIPQSYWGWMPITALAVLPLWQEIKYGGFMLEIVAPPALSEQMIRTWPSYGY